MGPLKWCQSQKPTPARKSVFGFGVALEGPWAHLGFLNAPKPKTAQIRSQQANQPASKPASSPTSQPASQSVSKPASQPAWSAWTSQPTSQQARQPASKPASQPASKPASQPAKSHLLRVYGPRRVLVWGGFGEVVYGPRRVLVLGAKIRLRLVCPLKKLHQGDVHVACWSGRDQYVE